MIEILKLAICCLLCSVAPGYSLSEKRENTAGALLLQSDAPSLIEISEEMVERVPVSLEFKAESLTHRSQETESSRNVSLWSDAHHLIHEIEEIVQSTPTSLQSHTQGLIHKLEEIVESRTPQFLKLACSESACSENSCSKPVSADLGFVQSIKIDPDATTCALLNGIIAYMSGGDEFFQEDEQDDTVAVLVIAAGEDSKLDASELKALKDKLAEKDESKDGALNAKERNALLSEWQKKTGLGHGNPATPGATMLLPLGTLQLCDMRGSTSSLSPMHFAPHLPFVHAVEIDTGETCSDLMTAVLCFAGDDMLFQSGEMDAFVALSVITAGDLKLDKDEMQELVKRLRQEDAAGVDGVFQKDELQKFLGVLQATVLLDTGSSANTGLPFIALACAEKEKDAKVGVDLGFVQSITIDPDAAEACTSLKKAIDYLGGADGFFQEDEKDDTVAALVIAAGKDSQLDPAELKALNAKLEAKDTTPKDGTLNAKERNAFMSEWQGKAGLGSGDIAQGGAPVLQPLGTLQLCDLSHQGSTSSLSPMHFAPHVPFVHAVEIDTGETCSELMTTIICFAGDDMLFQIKEMDALVALSVITAGDLKLDKDEMKKLVSRVKQEDAAGVDVVFQESELQNFLGALQAKLVFEGAEDVANTNQTQEAPKMSQKRRKSVDFKLPEASGNGNLPVIKVTEASGNDNSPVEEPVREEVKELEATQKVSAEKKNPEPKKHDHHDKHHHKKDHHTKKEEAPSGQRQVTASGSGSAAGGPTTADKGDTEAQRGGGKGGKGGGDKSSYAVDSGPTRSLLIALFIVRLLLNSKTAVI